MSPTMPFPTLPFPLYLVGFSQTVQELAVQPFPHARLLPLLQTPPAAHPRAAAHLLGQSISQGMPLFSTKIMPVRAARSSMRGLPPLDLGGSSGNSGSITSQSSSVTSSLAIPSHYPLPSFVRRT